jgi:uncharacterized membrane protein YphA (DoxX/SURF4 family)
MDRHKIAILLLRIGTAFAFIYAAIAGFVTPDDWIGYFPAFIQHMFPGNGILAIWGIVEIILGLWLLSGWKVFIPATIGVLSMLGLIVFDWSQMDVIFRDVTIAFALAALAVWDYRGTPKTIQ